MMSYTVDDIMRERVDDIMRERPDLQEYPRERVEELWAGRDAITPREIAELDIPINDAILILEKLLCELSPYRAHKITRQLALEFTPLWDCPDIIWWYFVTGDKSFSAAAIIAFGVAAGTISRAMAESWDAATRTEKLRKHLNIIVGAWEVTT